MLQEGRAKLLLHNYNTRAYESSGSEQICYIKFQLNSVGAATAAAGRRLKRDLHNFCAQQLSRSTCVSAKARSQTL